ncbi:MAG: ABC transporter substrate-binding protein [Chloroflexota bacterium]
MSNEEKVSTLMYRLRSGQLSRRKFIRALAVMGFSTAVAGELAACTSPAEPTPAPTAPAAQPGAPTAAPTQAPPATNSKNGGILKRGWQPPTQLDPAFQTSTSEIAACAQFYDWFVWIDENNKPAPALATSWEPNTSGTEWTFEMRKGVTFHNGKSLTIDDVIFTFNRLRNKDVGAATVELYSNITDITKVDDTHVKFVLENANPDLPADLGAYQSCVVSSEQKDYKTTYNGTGPFMLTSFSPEDRAIFKRNPNYWMKDLPYVDEVHDIYSPETSASVEALRGGQLNVVMGLPAELAETIKQEGKQTLLTKVSNFHFALHMRSDRGPTQDVRVRQALKAATDRSAILKIARLGYGTPGRDTPIGPSFPDYYLDVPEPKRDVAKAKQLLKDAGYENLSITLMAQNAFDIPKIAVVWKEQLAEASVTVEINQVPPDVYYQDTGWLEVDFGITEWGARPTPQPYLQLAYMTGAKWNSSHWSDPEMDQLAKQAATELDTTKRADLYKQIQQIFIDRGPIIVPYFEETIAATAPNVKGLAVHPDYPRSTMRTVYIEG